MKKYIFIVLDFNVYVVRNQNNHIIFRLSIIDEIKGEIGSNFDNEIRYAFELIIPNNYRTRQDLIKE